MKKYKEIFKEILNNFQQKTISIIVLFEIFIYKVITNTQKFLANCIFAYLVFQNRRQMKKIMKFQQKFEKDMKKLGLCLVALPDPKNPKKVLLEFIPEIALKKNESKI